MVFVLLGLTVSGALSLCRQALRPAACPSFISTVTSASTLTCTCTKHYGTSSTTSSRSSRCAPSGSSSDCNVLDEVESTLSKVFSGGITPQTKVVNLPADQREAAGVAINIRKRLDALARNNDCPRCWLQRKHCVCDQCPPCDFLPKINRLFLLTHHKEVGLVVDTAKLLLSSFPETSRLVVAGIGREYQVSMGELVDAMNGENARKCIVLFPSDDDARTFTEIESETSVEKDKFKSTAIDHWDVVVIDGTWQQARKLYNRYVPSEQEGGPWRVQLSREAVAILNGDNEPNDPGKIPGHQLRRHPIRWREVSTLEATRLLLRDMMGDDDSYDDPPNESSISEMKPWESLAIYQRIADEAAQRQLGPPRDRRLS